VFRAGPFYTPGPASEWWPRVAASAAVRRNAWRGARGVWSARRVTWCARGAVFGAAHS